MRFLPLPIALWLAVLAACAIATPASAMVVSIVQPGLPVHVRLEGEVQPGDAARVIRELNAARPTQILSQIKAKGPSIFDTRQWLWVDVESQGGDLEETMRIGRYFRAENVMITTKDGCTSSCSLLLAGAVERIGLEAAQGRIGVHRPYPAGARGGAMADFQKLFEATHKKVIEYLQDMGVPASLAEIMYAT